MSENTEKQQAIPDKYPVYGRPVVQQDDLQALRSAVVAQTALLRELSQQVRLSFEAQQAEYLSQQFEVAKQLAALAERLDKLASWLEAIQHTQSKQNHSLTRKKSKYRAARRKAKR